MEREGFDHPTSLFAESQAEAELILVQSGHEGNCERDGTP